MRHDLDETGAVRSPIFKNPARRQAARQLEVPFDQAFKQSLIGHAEVTHIDLPMPLQIITGATTLARGKLFFDGFQGNLRHVASGLESTVFVKDIRHPA